MFIKTLRLPLAMAALAVIAVTGCALDPMEKLSEDIDAQDIAVRKAAVLQLANLKDDRAIEALVDVLVNDDKIYNMAGVALVKQGREVVTEKKPDTILTMLGNAMRNVNSDLGNRSRAAWCMGEIGDREAIPALIGGTTAKTAGAEDAVAVRDAAKLALKKLGNDSDGAAFELPMDTFGTGDVKVLPEVKSVAPKPVAPAAAASPAKPAEKAPAKPATKAPAKAATKT
jgi:HEAT repeat protein